MSFDLRDFLRRCPRPNRYSALDTSLKVLGRAGQFGSIIYAVNEVVNKDPDIYHLLGAGAVFVAGKFLEESEIARNLHRYNSY